ncbi:MAG: type II toxin-antitoxin system VapC family toxin [Planctomycetes bacterium]|nr:type II toxin-antitoxin system VapC family toxin [Planctomycetota bacterium]
MAGRFAEERTPPSDQIQDRLLNESALVPAHWFLAVTNVLAMGELSQHISPADSSRFVQLLAEFEIEIDEDVSGQALDHLWPLCRSQMLTSCDGADLDLALRRQLPLASLDKELCRAANSLGVQFIGQ